MKIFFFLGTCDITASGSQYLCISHHNYFCELLLLYLTWSVGMAQDLVFSHVFLSVCTFSLDSLIHSSFVFCSAYFFTLNQIIFPTFPFLLGLQVQHIWNWIHDLPQSGKFSAIYFLKYFFCPVFSPRTPQFFEIVPWILEALFIFFNFLKWDIINIP